MSDPANILKGWALTARDLCDQGAKSVKLDLAGATVKYSPKKGARIQIDGQSEVVLSDADLDATGLVVAHEMDPIERAAVAGLLELEPAA